MNRTRIITRTVAALASVALTAGLAATNITAAHAGKAVGSGLTPGADTPSVPYSRTEPLMPGGLCQNVGTGKLTICSTGRAVGKKEYRYHKKQHNFYGAAYVNGGVPVFEGKRNSTQHVPVPEAFRNQRVTVEATMSVLHDPDCGWDFIFTTYNGQRVKGQVDKGKVYATGSGTTRIKGNALTFNVPKFERSRYVWFIDLTITRADGKQYKVTVLSQKAVKNGPATFTFGN